MRRFATILIPIILFLPVLVGCERPLSVRFPLAPTPAVTFTSQPAPGIGAQAGALALAKTPLPAAGPAAAGAENAPLWVTNPVDRTVLRIDPAANAIAASIPIEGQPDIILPGENAVWVLDREHNLVFRIDPQTNRPVASIPLPAGKAEDLAVGAGSVWVGMIGTVNLTNQVQEQDTEILPPGMVIQIDAKNNQFLGQYPVQPVGRLFVSGSALWVLSRTVIDTPLQVIDLNSKQGMAVPLQNAPTWLPVDAFTVDSAGLWLFSSAYSQIFHASPDGRIGSTIQFQQRQPTGYADLLLHRSGLWAATPWGTVLHIDPPTNRVTGTLDLQVPLTKLLSGGGSVWAFSQQTASLFRIDPGSNAVTAQVATGSQLQPTVVPSPTPRVVIWKPCPDAPTSRLKVGDLAYVTKDPPVPNRVRKEPNKQAEILGLINPGGSMEILEGPTCADNWVWWKVKNADLNGWTAEGDPETYWLVPLYK